MEDARQDGVQSRRLLLPWVRGTNYRNSIRLFDMSGNAAEWTEEANDGENAIVVGGSFKESAASRVRDLQRPHARQTAERQFAAQGFDLKDK
jgi:hypothetical protein